jgi:pimeloyl-ACP methyl ester carboxylesterase
MTYEPRPSVVRATVVAGRVTTEYLCAGSGRPLLVLATEGRREALMDAVPEGFRVLAPVGDDALRAIDPEALLELLDGLGLWDVHVVADSEFAALARRCAERFADRFVSVVIVDSAAIDLRVALASLGP